MFSTLENIPCFEAPFGALVCGPTMSGKSVFVSDLIINRNQMISKHVDRVVYSFGEWQPGFDKLQRTVGSVLEFHSGLGNILEPGFFDPASHTLLVLDDLAQEIANHPRAAQLFTQGIHHRGVSVIFITQNLYKQGRAMRDISLNCQYLILFQNPRDINQVKVLANQTGLTHLPTAFDKVTSEPYQPLIIDMKSTTPAYLRLRSHVSPKYPYMRIYVKKSSQLPCRKTSVS